MSTTPNMSLTLPEVLVTSGPTYATQINTALDVIDDHDHSSGKGKKITPSGLNINADLTLANNALTNTKSVQLTTQASVAALGAIYKKGDDLYYRDGSNNEVRLTLGGNVNVSATGAFTGLTAPASAVYTPAASTFSYLSNATTYAKQSIGDLSVYSRLGAIGTVQAVTLKADVATTAYDFIMPLTSPTANQMIRMDGSNPAKFINLLGTANQVTVTHNASDTTLSLPQNIDAASSPTFAGLTLTGTLTGTAMNLSGALSTTAINCDSVTATTSLDAPAITGTTVTTTGNITTSSGNITATAGNITATAGNVNAVDFNFTGNITGSASSIATIENVVSDFVVGGTYLFPAPSTDYLTASELRIPLVRTDDLAGRIAANGVNIFGRTSGVAIPSTYVGYFNSVALPSSVPSSTSLQNILVWSLPAGIWDVSAFVRFRFSVSQSVAIISQVDVDVSTTSATLTNYPATVNVPNVGQAAGAAISLNVFPKRLNLSTTTTIYLVGRSFTNGGTNQGDFWSVGTFMQAIRVG